MFDTPSAGPLSPIVGLERRKFEQQNVPPGQEQMAAAAGGIPISGDLAQLIQLNRALQQRGIAQQQGNPAPSTVAQDLRQMAMQQMQQQGPQMVPQMNARQQGIANLPVGNLGVKGMAGGGIVAFNGEDESLVRSPYDFNMIEDEANDATDIRNLLPGKFRVSDGVRRQIAEQEKPQREEQARQAAAKTPSVESMIKRNAAAPAGGLAKLVPTLTGGAGTVSDYDRMLDVMRASANRPLAERIKEREELEKQYGLDKIRAAREAEMGRREKELSPEAQRKAFLNNLSTNWNSQIGQRGVSTSSRLAQMVGAYGATKSATAEQFKKSTQDLTQAKLDMQEKTAIAQMTGAMSDRKAAEDAQKQYMDALEKQRTADRLAKQQEATEAHNRAMEKATMARIGESRNPFELYGPQLTNLDRQIDAMEDKVSAMPSGSAQRTAAEAQLETLKNRREDLIDRVQRLSPGAYSADVRAAGQDAKRNAKKQEELNKPTSEYSRLKKKLIDLDNSKTDSYGKKLTPEELKKRKAEIEGQLKRMEVDAGLASDSSSSGVIPLD